MQKRIARTVGNFGEAEPFVRIEPLYDRTDRRAVGGQRLADSGARLGTIARGGRSNGFLLVGPAALTTAAEIPTSPHYGVSSSGRLSVSAARSALRCAAFSSFFLCFSSLRARAARLRSARCRL